MHIDMRAFAYFSDPCTPMTGPVLRLGTLVVVEVTM
jgi:hypothetical protein